MASKVGVKMGQMKDGVVLMYIKDRILYPVALTEEQNDVLQFTAMLFNSMKVLVDQPIGQAINLAEKKTQH